jgi:hypothetical protein
MQVYVSFNKIANRYYGIDISNTTLTVTRNVRPNGNSSANAVVSPAKTFDLQQVINDYSVDHGCITLIDTGDSKYEWVETTHLTAPYRAPYGKTFSSLYVGNNAVDDSANTVGNINYASPFWALRQLNQLDKNFRPIMYVLTPSENCSVDDAVVIYKDTTDMPDHTTLTVNGVQQTNATVSQVQSIKTFLNGWNPIHFTTVNSTAFVVSANTTGNIYLNSDAGVLNRTVAKSGQTVVINTEGLPSGEQITVKAGYKYYPNISNTVITVE